MAFVWQNNGLVQLRVNGKVASLSLRCSGENTLIVQARCKDTRVNCHHNETVIMHRQRYSAYLYINIESCKTCGTRFVLTLEASPDCTLCKLIWRSWKSADKVDTFHPRNLVLRSSTEEEKTNFCLVSNIFLTVWNDKKWRMVPFRSLASMQERQQVHVRFFTAKCPLAWLWSRQSINFELILALYWHEVVNEKLFSMLYVCAPIRDKVFMLRVGWVSL